MKTIWKYFFLLLSTSVSAQNLVPNPSFEDFISCPTWISEVDSVVNWFSVSQSPDYYNACSSVSVCSVPKNVVGYQNAHSGNAYCGMICYYAGDGREYIGSHLLDSLVTGVKYFISFYLSHAEGYSAESCNKFGCKFSTTSFIYNSVLPDNKASFYSNIIVVDTENWTFIKGSFIADSAYKYIALGNFFDNAHTDTMGGNFNRKSYYYIDDVCLTTDSNGCSLENNVQHIVSPTPMIFPNPAQNLIEIRNINPQSVSLYNIVGKEQTIQISASASSTNIDVSKLSRGIYFIQVKTANDENSFVEKIILQ